MLIRYTVHFTEELRRRKLHRSIHIINPMYIHTRTCTYCTCMLLSAMLARTSASTALTSSELVGLTDIGRDVEHGTTCSRFDGQPERCVLHRVGRTRCIIVDDHAKQTCRRDLGNACSGSSGGAGGSAGQRATVGRQPVLAECRMPAGPARRACLKVYQALKKAQGDAAVVHQLRTPPPSSALHCMRPMAPSELAAAAAGLRRALGVPAEGVETCAVVGSSGSLLQYKARLGSAIDSHGLVIRFNDAPTAVFESYVGARTDLRVLNSNALMAILERCRLTHGLGICTAPEGAGARRQFRLACGCPQRALLNTGYEPLAWCFQRACGGSLPLRNETMEAAGDPIGPSGSSVLRHPLVQAVSRTHGGRKSVMSGLYGFALALQLCTRRVNALGFTGGGSVDGSAAGGGNSSRFGSPYHYYDQCSHDSADAFAETSAMMHHTHPAFERYAPILRFHNAPLSLAPERAAPGVVSTQQRPFRIRACQRPKDAEMLGRKIALLGEIEQHRARARTNHHRS